MKSIKTIGIVLFVLTLISPVMAFSVVVVAEEATVFGLAAFSKLKEMLFFLIVPLISLIFGIVATAKGHPAKKNIIVAPIVAFFITILALFSFQETVDESGEFLRNAEQVTHIAFPNDVKAKSMAFDDGRLGNAKLLNIEEEREFANTTKQSPWRKSLPPASVGIIPNYVYSTTDSFDARFLFIVETKAFNPDRITSGRYNIVYAAYYKARHQITVFDQYVAVVD